MKKYMTLTIVLSLCACTQYQWVKPGTTPRQLQLDETACQAKSLKELHPDNVVMDKNTSYDRDFDEMDTSYSREDANEDARDTLIRDCMYQKGWTQEVVR